MSSGVITALEHISYPERPVEVAEVAPDEGLEVARSVFALRLGGKLYDTRV